jgi:hypothetical protein
LFPQNPAMLELTWYPVLTAQASAVEIYKSAHKNLNNINELTFWKTLFYLHLLPSNSDNRYLSEDRSA